MENFVLFLFIAMIKLKNDQQVDFNWKKICLRCSLPVSKVKKKGLLQKKLCRFKKFEHNQ